ncbi:MAG: CDP-alcohol phosphatidyltransferase family protein [Deltaproteobacteria bacterium]|nr:CDP-alcohol phosphatidyltransferase family protein [Deltaproteobacteria bacterium]
MTEGTRDEPGARTFLDRWRATRKGFKPTDVEEPIDYHWHRPLAGLLVEVLRDTPITPNQVTIASGIASLVAGLMMGLAGWYGRWLVAAGGAMLLVSIVLDCADGQLARIRGTTSPVGRILDGLVDIVAPVSVMHGLAFYLVRQGYTYGTVWPLGWLAALSLLWHAGVYDVHKNVYLHGSNPNFSIGGATLVTIEDIRGYEAEYRARGERFYAFLMKVFVKWTLPQLGVIEPWLAPQRRIESEAEREAFRTIFRPRMAAMTWLGFGTHLFLLTIAAWLAPLGGAPIWTAWIVMFGPMNLVCAWIALTQRRAVREFEARLVTLRAASKAA